jgi:hypothetical protein
MNIFCQLLILVFGYKRSLTPMENYTQPLPLPEVIKKQRN